MKYPKYLTLTTTGRFHISIKKPIRVPYVEIDLMGNGCRKHPRKKGLWFGIHGANGDYVMAMYENEIKNMMKLIRNLK